MSPSALQSGSALGIAEPLSAPLADDRAARALLQQAQGAIQKWPEGFPGFRARLTVALDGRERSGWALVGPGGEIEVDLEADVARDWVRAVLAELTAERMPRFFKDGDGRFPIAFDPAASEDGQGSRLVVQRGAHGLSPIAYRIDERARLRQCELTDHGLRLVHTYETFCRATPGRVLPARRSIVAYDADALVRTEVIEDTHRRVCHTWLPARRWVQVSELDARSVREARFDAHTLL
jgi:hypothetical protein